MTASFYARPGPPPIESGDEIVDTSIAASLLGVSQVRVRQYILQGAVTAQGERVYLLAQVRSGVWVTTHRVVEGYRKLLGPRPRPPLTVRPEQ